MKCSTPEVNGDVKTSKRPRQMPPYNVILVNDNDHTFNYVIKMLQDLFFHDETKANALAKEVDEKGKVVVFTTHKEYAELKREQIQAHGPDVLCARCKGSMSCYIEPVQ